MKKAGLFFLLLPFISYAQVGIITTIAGNDTAGYSGDNGPAILASLNVPQYIASDNSGNLYIADKENNRIRKINTSGIITTIAGTGIAGFSGDSGQATEAQLHIPTCVVPDTIGNLYIVDGANYRIRKINSLGIITTIAGNGIGGYSGDNIAATATEIAPYAIALDNLGNIYESDNPNRVRKISTSGIITTIAGNGSYGFSGDGGPATNATFNNIGYITVSSTGEIYIPDWENYRVRKIDTAGIITTVAGNGIMGNSGDGGTADSAELTAPNAVNFDKEGNYYISDNLAYVVRKVNTLGIISTIAGNGTLGFSGDGGPATGAQMNRPNSVAFNSAGNMFIDDGFNNRIRKVTYNTTGVKNIQSPQNNISLYPNPATNTITLTSAASLPNAEVMISNVLGEVVFNKSYNNLSQTDIDVGGFANGVYFVKVNGVYAGKFVKE